MPTSKIVADYQSPNASQSFSVKLPTASQSAGSVKDKTEHLSALRKGTSELQSQINTFLTKKMEEDKASGSHKTSAKDTMAEKEEQLYGEEDPEGF